MGDLETNLAHIAACGYNGVELAIRDPKLVDLASLEKLVHKYNLNVPAIGTGQAWGRKVSHSRIQMVQSAGQQ